jgi:hypothetical protein
MPGPQPGEGRPVIEFFYICIVFPAILGVAMVSAWLAGPAITNLILRIGGDE